MTDKVQNDWAGPRVAKDMGDGTFAPVEYVGQTDASGNVRVTLATQIAGEDLNNNALITETNTVVTKTQNAVSLANNASNSSSGIATGNYRKFRTVAAGASGNLDLKVEWSPDNGTSGWYYVNDQGAAQFPGFTGDVVAPYLRVTVTNQFASTQTINAWLVLSL